MAAVTVEAHVAPLVARSRTRQDVVRVIALVFVLDSFLLAASVPLAMVLKFGPGNWHPSGIQWLTGYPIIDFGWVVPLWLATLVVLDAYSRRHFARGSDEFKILLKGSFTAAALASMLAYLVNYDMSRGFYLYVFLIGAGLLLSERYAVSVVVARLRRGDQLMHRVVAVGSDTEIRALRSVLDRRRELGYQIVATSAPEGAVAACGQFGADTLLVAGGSLTSSAELRKIGWQLEDADIDLVVVPSLIDVAGPRIHTRPVSGLPFMHIEPPQVARAMKWGKALFDRLGSLLLLIALSPVLVLIAVMIKAENGGPVFFRHRRVGVAGSEFSVWKFRSMVNDAEALHEEMLAASDSDVLLFKVKSDPRVTRVGSFIRRYSLDELPQLLNVLKGDMSLVGPRPQVPAEVAAYVESDHRRLLVRPGITGLWQVSGRSNLTWEEAVRLDLYYVDNWSMIGDIVILFKTVRAVLRHEGAY